MPPTRDPAAHLAVLDERELVRRAAQGDAKAFEELDVRHRTRLTRFVQSRLRDPEDARDVVQEAFLEAYRGLQRFRGDSAFASWLAGIARNRVGTHHRLRSRYEPLSGNPFHELAVVPRIESRIDARRALERCADLLSSVASPLQYRTFLLRYAEKRSVRSIATELGETPENVKVRLFRTRQILRRDSRLADLTAMG